MRELMDEEWQEVLTMPRGHVAAAYEVDGLPVMILRGAGSLCAYVGVPKTHPIAGKDYDDLDINCHGGLTYAAEAHGDWPPDFYWYGWDYGHLGDAQTFDACPNWDDHEWTVADVKGEIPEVVEQFK